MQIMFASISSSSKFQNFQNFQESSKKTNINDEIIKWNFADIEFFDFNYDEKFMKTTNSVIHKNKDTYYKNVSVFVKKIKKNDHRAEIKNNQTEFIDLLDNNILI